MTDTPPEMTVADALSTVRRVSNMYTAMKRIEDVLVMVEKGSTELSAQERRKAKLRTEIDAAKSELDGLTARAETLKGELAAKRSASAAEADIRRRAIDDLAATAEARAAGLTAREAAVAKAEDDQAGQRRALEDWLVAAKDAEAAATAAKADFEARTAKLKSIME